MLTHRNLVANILQTADAGHYIDGEDTTIAFLPFFHIYGLTVIVLMGVWSGATLVVDAEVRARARIRSRGTPSRDAAARRPAHRRRARQASVRRGPRLLVDPQAVLGRGAARRRRHRAMHAPHRLHAAARLRPHGNEPRRVHHAGGHGQIKPGSVGRPVANTECRVVDAETGRDVAPGTDGEIWIRGPQVMRGYLGRPDETRAMIDDEGWLRSGDIGHADDDGYFFIVDRVKELIKYKGMQVPPAELEAVLLSHPAVADAAVVPLADAECGEIPRAFVVLKGAATAEELMAYVAERVTPYKKVRRLEFIDAIPKSPSGKILRRLLKDRAT